MSANNSGAEGGQEKNAPEGTVQSIPQNLTTIQNIQTVQNIQNVQNAVSSNIQSIQTAQTVTGQTTTLVGKSVSVEFNPKIIMKPTISSNIGTSESNKITSTFCPVSQVRIIAPSMLSSIERQSQSQAQQTSQQTQIVTSIPSTYHVPRGPAAVASISTPRSTVATPLVRAINTGQSIPISRAGSSTSGKTRATVAVANSSLPSTSRVADASTHSNAADFGKTVTICKSRNSQEHGTADVARTVREITKIPLKKRFNVTCVTTTTIANTQWQSKNTPVVYAQPQRHAVPVANRPAVRPVATTVYTSQPQQQQQQAQAQQQQAQQQQQQVQAQTIQGQPRLVNPSPIGVVRPMPVVTPTSSRLIAPVLQAQGGNITRLPVPTRPPTPQVVMSMPQVSQATGKTVTQIQPNQTSRSINTTPINRVAVTNPVIAASNRVSTVTSVQTSVGRQLTINTVAGAAPGTVSRIVIPQTALQQTQQQQSQQQSQPGATRVVQTVTPLANFSQVSRVIATTSTNAGVAGNVTRVAQTGPTSVARITGMSLHSLPAALTPARGATPLKVTTQTSGIQTVQLKQATPTLQPQPQPQVSQQSQPQQQPVQSQTQSGPTIQRAIGTNASIAPAASVVTSQQQPAQLQGQYLHATPHSTTYYSIDASGTYSQYRSTTMQPVRLLVEQGFEEPLGKPNASPRPSILRKREVDSSPGKGIAKNLVPVLAAMPASLSAPSPPGSPKGDRDGGGNHSSGSTTVSATSSPGLDEEPEQSRIPINTTVEMSPRKKPRKQQLTGVELTEPRCTDEEMQFIEEKFKKEIKEESKDKYGERKYHLNQQDTKTTHTTPVKSKPSLCMIGTSWKDQYGGRLHHYKRPSDVKPREDKKININEISQQKQVMQKVDGWKLYHLKTQLDELSEVEKTAHKELKITMTGMEPLRGKNKQDDAILENINELLKGNMQRHSLVSEGLIESREQLFSMHSKHKPYVRDLLQRNSNKRVQKKRDK